MVAPGQQRFPLFEDEKDPATELMKIVAAKAPTKKHMKKVFSEKEIAEIEKKQKEIEEAKAPKEDNDRKLLREKYRKIKRQVKEMEVGNQSRVIVFPCLTNGDGWYKVVEFSALYYAYRLADRMGRRAHVMKDSDKYLKCVHTASLTNIERFVEQFKDLEEPEVEVTEDGIYIFTLKKPLTDDEVGALRRTEETRREKTHTLLKPKAMDPATFQAILIVARQVTPRVRKLEKQYYHTLGEDMVKDIHRLLAVYFDFSNGLYDRKTAGEELIRILDRLFAAIAILSEVRVWAYDICMSIGENVNEVRRIVVKNFEMGNEK